MPEAADVPLGQCSSPGALQPQLGQDGSLAQPRAVSGFHAHLPVPGNEPEPRCGSTSGALPGAGPGRAVQGQPRGCGKQQPAVVLLAQHLLPITAQGYNI